MLSRTADNLYWLARYVERAEFVARILEATQRLTAMPLSYIGGTNEWESAVATAGSAKAFAAHYPEANEETAIDFLAFSTANPSSIRNCFEMARGNARAVRTALTAEMWDVINGAWIELQRFGNGPSSREELSRFLRWVQETSLRFDGSAYRSMLRNDAYWFTRLGAHRLSLGLSREPQAVARRRSAHPQRPDAALARQLLREPGALPRRHRARLRPPGGDAAQGAHGAHAAAEQPDGRDLPDRPAPVHLRARS